MLKKALRLGSFFCIVFGLYFFVGPTLTNANSIENNQGQDPFANNFYIKFTDTTERGRFKEFIQNEQAANAIGDILPKSNKVFENSEYPLLRTQKIPRHALENYLNAQNIGYEFIEPVPEMTVSDIDYNDDAYARSHNQERTVHQHGSIGYCPASAIGAVKTLVIVDNALYVDHEDLDVSWTYDVVDDDTDVLGGDASVYFGRSHGTKVTGRADAVTNNTLGVASMSEGRGNVAFVKATTVSGNTNGLGISHGVEGLLYAVDNGADVVNLSFGAEEDCDQTFSGAVAYAISNGVTVVVSAGNDGNNSPLRSPANCPGVIAVGSTDEAKYVSSFTSGTGDLDICAPGEDVHVAVRSRSGPDLYGKSSGTSFAAPVIAGIIAAGVDPFSYTTPSLDGICDIVDLTTCGTGPVCGDGIKTGTEECDDGNTTSMDGCSSSCAIEYGCYLDITYGYHRADFEIEYGNVYTGLPVSALPAGKNAVLHFSYLSDPEETFSLDGITGETGAVTELDVTYVEVKIDGTTWCSFTPSLSYCGDSNKNTPDEECDDGNNTNGDNCSSTCELESDCGNGVVDTGTTGSFSMYINAGTNDSWEQISNGQTYPSGSDLPLGAKQGLFPSIVGLRFTGLPIPEDAIIDDAYLQFATDYVRTNATSLSITTEDSSSPASFSSSSYDLSSRTDVGSSVSRSSIPTWTPVGSTHQSPDISSIVQDVVDRGDRGSGDNMVFLIDGTGAREAESYEGAGGTQSLRPMLYIEWSLPGEECDDGNTNNGDGCSQTCQDE